MAFDVDQLRQSIMILTRAKDEAQRESAELKMQTEAALKRAETAEAQFKDEQSRREEDRRRNEEERLSRVLAAESEAARLQEATDALLASRQSEQQAAAREAEARDAARDARDEGHLAVMRLMETREAQAAERATLRCRLEALRDESCEAEAAAKECLSLGTELVLEFQERLSASLHRVSKH